MFSQPDPSDPTCIYFGPTKFKVVQGRSFTEDRFMSFRWDHYADLDKRIDPSTSNIVDIYVLTSDYVRKVNKWIAEGFKATIPTAPNNYELKSLMSSIEPKAAIADHISYIPKFKFRSCIFWHRVYTTNVWTCCCNFRNDFKSL